MLSHSVFQAPRRESRRSWEALMGKWASALSPPLESSLKGLERWCRGLFPFLPLCFFPPSCSSGEAREQSEGFGQTHHAHEWNTRHWWLHRAEIRLPSITSLERLVMKDRISRSGSYSTLLYSVWTLFCSFFFCVTKYCGSAAKFPLFSCKSKNREEMIYHENNERCRSRFL